MARIQKRITKSGKIKYDVTIRLKGHPPVCGCFESLTKARNWIQETETSIRDNRYSKTAASRKHTFAEMIDRYINNDMKNHTSYPELITAQLNWWKEQLGMYYLIDITAPLLAECRDKLQNEPYKIKVDKQGKIIKKYYRSGSTVNRYMAALSSAFNTAVNDYGWIDENPLRKVSKRKEAKGRERELTNEEKEALLTACKNSSSPYLYLIVIIAMSTGGRFSEICNLQHNDVIIERKNKSASLIFRDTKNGDTRKVFLYSHGYELLKEHIKVRSINSSYLFPRKDGKKPIDIRKQWEKALKNAKLSDFRFHDLRHHAASALAMNGAGLMDLSHILGHKTLQMVKRYTHLTEKHTAEIMKKMNQNEFSTKKEGTKNG